MGSVTQVSGPGTDPVGEVVALLIAAAAEHEDRGRKRLARSHLRRARRLVQDLGAAAIGGPEVA